jgi:hypothetical protein
MDAVARLEAIEAIRALKARYFRLMDTRIWNELAGVFTADLRVLAEDGSVWLEGGQAFADSLARSLDGARSVHQGFLPEIEIVDRDHATGTWAMHDMIAWQDRHPTQGWRAIDGYGHYHESYRREDGEWRIATLMLNRLRLDVVHAEEA